MKKIGLMNQFRLLKKEMIRLLERLVIPAEAEPAPQLMRGIQVSSTGSLFSQGQAWIPVFTGMTTRLKQQKNLFKELKGLSFLRKQESRSHSLALMNSKGISVLFLVIAMLLMVTIGYVFSYLIPTKQKSVRFPIYSTQAFYIAQSGVEYAIRYASDRGWRGATDGAPARLDLDRLNDVVNNQRNLGNGSFTINYNTGTNTLISTGQITGVSENRVVRVSNFSPFLRLVFVTSPLPYRNPYWSTGTSRARFFITNVRSTAVVLNSFSASWNAAATRYIRRIYFNVGGAFPGTLKYLNPTATTYANGSGVANFNRPLGGPFTYTINPGTVYGIEIRWSANTNATNIIITFYDTAGNGYTFNLDSAGNGL